jgi:LmbE family N-acetylglucosaminyl deacetylase
VSAPVIAVVLAHPDDESFPVGGTVAKCSSEGVQVDLIMVARGEAGIPGRTAEEAAVIREAELHKACEELQELLDALAQRDPPSQVQLIRNELPTIDLPDSSVDLSWAAFVYHEMKSDGLAAELRRVVRPNGQVAILDWRPDGKTDSEPPAEHGVWPEQVRQALYQAGFAQVSETWRDSEAYLIEAK